MKVAVVQLEPVLGHSTATWERLGPLLEEAAGAGLVVLPELCNSGYAFTSAEEARRHAEPVASGPFVARLVEHAARHDLHLVTGLDELGEDGRVYNSAVLLGPSGPLATYRKIHLFDREKLYFEPGSALSPVVEVRGCRVAMAICFDWMFPELWRLLALGGADVVCHPSNLVIPGRCQRAVPVHAMLNRVFILTANRIGSERDLSFTGRSLIADPSGALLAEASAARAEVIQAEIDPERARDKQVTQRNDLLRDRRPALYGGLVESAPHGDVSHGGGRKDPSAGWP